MTPLLEVEDLVVEVRRHRRSFRAVNGVSFSLERARALAIVGESGSGKSLTLRAIMGLLPASGSLASGRVIVDGVELEAAVRGHGRGHRQRERISIIFQDALSALNPVATVGHQIAEAPRHVLGLSRSAARARALELLYQVGIPDPERRYRAYPHELSGGTRQRVMIAIALSSDPSILLCDEPTTALDVTIQTQILALLAELRSARGLALVFVTHDLGVVGQVADDLAVMYTGRIVEKGPTAEVLAAPRHPYTAGLLAAAIDVDTPEREPLAIPGTLPDPQGLPSGCTFHPRCSFATPECTTTEVALAPVGTDRLAACLHSEALAATQAVPGRG
ncbi:MAG: ABC transporter ATP-binding protein [Acidimicrobiales bacterium]|jgi:peptide/nickel transport system ATP-binding protein/oligopeptide transport system ATP-binding protein